jgi:hypothetical protein
MLLLLLLLLLLLFSDERKVKLIGHVTHIVDIRNAYAILVGKMQVKTPYG